MTRRYLYSGPMQSIAIRASDNSIADTAFVPGETVDLDPKHAVTACLVDAGYLSEAPEDSLPQPTGTALVIVDVPGAPDAPDAPKE